jgi:tetratricopeptide (TPR) repeat protein
VILGIITIWSGKQINNTNINLIEFAWGYLKMGQVEEAKNYALGQITDDPKDVGSYELLGYLALNDKQYEQAIFYLSKAVQLAPQHHTTQYNLALSLSRTKQFDKSLSAIESAIKYAALPEYLFFRGQVLEEAGDIKNAIFTYENLLDKAKPTKEWQQYVSKAQERLDFIRH